MSGVRVWRWVASESRRAVRLDEIDWTVRAGEHWVLIGPNRAGLEEIPASASHALLLSAGRIVTAGPIEQALSADSVSTAFGIEASLARRKGRWSATVDHADAWRLRPRLDSNQRPSD